MRKTFRKFSGKTYMLDEFSYSDASKAESEKRKSMWKKSGLSARCIKKANGRYVDIGNIKEVLTRWIALHCFPMVESPKLLQD